ncbi:carboxypeptidase-like regulatory domain-containing protein, partial [Lacticaseibacillus paracasei]
IPGTTYIAKTDAEGRFIVGFLPAGTYDVRADRDGYGSLEWQNVVVKRQDTTALPESLMRVATGPEIELFALGSGGTVALKPLVDLKLG